jgi:hypothetical protein
MMKLSAVIGLFFMIWVMHFVVVKSNIRLQVEATGINWMHMGSVTIPMSESAYIGLAVTSHNDRLLCTSTIDNVSVTP